MLAISPTLRGYAERAWLCCCRTMLRKRLPPQLIADE